MLLSLFRKKKIYITQKNAHESFIRNFLKRKRNLIEKVFNANVVQYC